MLLLACTGSLAQEKPTTPAGTVDASGLAQLVVRWWQWRVALPDLATPAKDPAGRFCDVGQPADVWFLAGYLATGSDSAKIRRTCRLGVATRVFVPVVTMVNYPRTETSPLTCEQAKAKVKAAVDPMTGLVAELDGQPLPHVDQRRMAAEGCFPLFKAIGSLETGFPAAADGYWLLLDPLPTGHHILRLGARFAGASRDVASFQDTIYDLDVR